MSDATRTRTPAPVNVQHADEGLLFDRRSQGLVDAVHDASKETCVDVFKQRVPAADGARPGDRSDVSVCGRFELGVAQPVGHFVTGNPR